MIELDSAVESNPGFDPVPDSSFASDPASKLEWSADRKLAIDQDLNPAKPSDLGLYLNFDWPIGSELNHQPGFAVGSE